MLPRINIFIAFWLVLTYSAIFASKETENSLENDLMQESKNQPNLRAAIIEPKDRLSEVNFDSLRLEVVSSKIISNHNELLSESLPNLRHLVSDRPKKSRPAMQNKKIEANAAGNSDPTFAPTTTPTKQGHDVDREKDMEKYGTPPSKISKSLKDKSAIIPILMFATKRSGLYHTPGVLGSLLQNDAVKQLDIYLMSDKHAREFMAPMIEPLQNLFHNFTMLSMEKILSTWKHTHVTNHSIPMYHNMLLRLDVISYLPPHLDAVMLMDTDMIAVEDVSNLYYFITVTKPGKYLYMTREAEDNGGWYNIKEKTGKKHFYPPHGLNGGIIYFNLTLLRKDGLDASKFLKVNDEAIDLAEQDVLNTWAYYNQDKVGVIPDKWNRRMENGLFLTRDSPPLLNQGNRHKIPEEGIYHGSHGRFFENSKRKNYVNDHILFRSYTEYFFDKCSISASHIHATLLRSSLHSEEHS